MNKNDKLKNEIKKTIQEQPKIGRILLARRYYISEYLARKLLHECKLEETAALAGVSRSLPVNTDKKINSTTSTTSKVTEITQEVVNTTTNTSIDTTAARTVAINLILNIPSSREIRHFTVRHNWLDAITLREYQEEHDPEHVRNERIHSYLSITVKPRISFDFDNAAVKPFLSKRATKAYAEIEEFREQFMDSLPKVVEKIMCDLRKTPFCIEDHKCKSDYFENIRLWVSFPVTPAESLYLEKRMRKLEAYLLSSAFKNLIITNGLQASTDVYTELLMAAL